MAGGHDRKFDLTRHELEILAEVVGGYTNEAIAQRLSVSEQTVTSHLANISDKLGASDRLEVILFAIHYRILEDSEIITESLIPLIRDGTSEKE